MPLLGELSQKPICQGIIASGWMPISPPKILRLTSLNFDFFVIATIWDVYTVTQPIIHCKIRECYKSSLFHI